MAKLSKQDYEFLKSLDKKDLTQEDLNDILEYERSEAGAPSQEDMNWAVEILNEKNPLLQAEFRKSGDYEKANKIISQSRAANQVMQQKGQSPYVKKVERIPDDVQSNFNFNWKSAYENTHEGEKLRRTEGDADKLQKFIDSYMYEVDDPVKLQQIAYNLHMYNPNTMSWSEFINSEQGDEFKKYIKDVQKYQTEKAVEDIWSGKDPVKVNYPLIGPTDIPLSKQAVDFMLPVSKEYAKKHYNDEDFSLTGPLMTDAFTNLVMAGPGVAEALPAKVGVPVAKAMNRPLISTVYGNVAAPAITEAGNVIYNDESIPEAFIRTGEGAAINFGTPRMLEGITSWAGRGLPTKEGNRSVQKMLDEAANKAAKVQDDIRKGKPYAYYVPDMEKEFIQNTKNGRVMYSLDPAKSKAEHEAARAALGKSKDNITYKSLEEMPPESVTSDEWKSFVQGLPFVRGKEGNTEFAQKIKEIQDTGKEYLKDDLLIKKAESLAKDGDLRNLTPVDLRQLGFADKESFVNYLIRTIKMKSPSTLSSYMTNAAGRPEFGRRAGPIRNINYLLGTNLFGKDESVQEKQKSRIQRLLGL